MKILQTFAALAVALGVTGQAQTPLKTVDHVDLQRYLGRWYEIARIPNRFEKKCVRDVTAEYAMDGSDITVRNTCVQADGKPNIAKGKAKVVDKTTSAKLKVTFFWPFYGNYWIIGLDPDYRWAIVGEPGRKYGWILARTPSLPAATLDAIRQQFAASGYRPADLIYPQQTTAH
ncbi:bacterial lipocalin [Terriglobus roseus DSM 18391]|uniref:Bacterial lipocalin n=1 Tax=Terriglobus roseus (strain DSM 18391 / NRRL B-41598 / KBS 63) TaxID=926566 RepID=I3ZMQ4_TERRK|nr:lipocalin family protein [Terriglobus roseus]AFL90522.1 bacterial lipocalin [Terriglobus roseus DSM 18391]